MNVRVVCFSPTELAKELERPALTPELFASIGARYSRNNEGYDSIVAMLEGKNPDKAVDAIFNMLDYGHASIADMVPVAMLLEGISLVTAYKLWKLSPQGSGQESSTRYIEMNPESVYIPTYMEGEELTLYTDFISSSFSLYKEGLEYWASILEAHPHLLVVPETANQKAKERMKRNFIFDRARYALPSSAKTNMVLYQSARAWVEVYKWLATYAASEEEFDLADLILKELKVVAPRMVKHACHDKGVESIAQADIERKIVIAELLDLDTEYTPYLQVQEPQVPFLDSENYIEALAPRLNRYSPCGKELTMTSVTYGWSYVSFAEIRDMNRHRTGSKYSAEIPVAVYTASDQSPSPQDDYLVRLDSHLRKWGNYSKSLLVNERDIDYLFWTNLGTCFNYYQTTTADKFIYTSELRTGLGAHYKYCQNFKDVLALWYDKFPETKGLIIEGSGEPE